MSFGYAIGDFIAGANLAYQLIHLMTETRGASDEYQEAMSELCSIQQAFIHVSQITRSSILPQATLNSASFIVLSSMQIIAKFLDRSKRYRKGLSDPNTGGVSASWCKVGWGLFKKDELVALRDQLHCRLVAINTLFTAANYSHALPSSISQFQVPETNDTSSLADSAIVINDNTSIRSSKIDPEELERLVQERYREELEKREAQAAREKDELKWRWTLERDAAVKFHQEEHKRDMEKVAQRELERLEAERILKERSILAEARAKIEADMEKRDKSPVRLKDAVGRKFAFPFHLVQTWTGMEEMIKSAFLHVDYLRDQVQQGYYDLIGPDGEIIPPTVWESFVQPDMSVSMHMWPMDRIPLPPPVEPLNIDKPATEGKAKSRVLGRFVTGLVRRKQPELGQNSKAVQTAR